MAKFGILLIVFGWISLASAGSETAISSPAGTAASGIAADRPYSNFGVLKFFDMHRASSQVKSVTFKDCRSESKTLKLSGSYADDGQHPSAYADEFEDSDVYAANVRLKSTSGSAFNGPKSEAEMRNEVMKSPVLVDLIHRGAITQEMVDKQVLCTHETRRNPHSPQFPELGVIETETCTIKFCVQVSKVK